MDCDMMPPRSPVSDATDDVRYEHTSQHGVYRFAPSADCEYAFAFIGDLKTSSKR